MTPEQRRILASKPIDRMRRFADLLHWRGLQLETIRFSDDDRAPSNMPPAGILVFYMTTDLKFNLQINELDTTPPFTHQATIKADRYGICNIGWHPFSLFEAMEALRNEAERLRPILDRRLYKNRKWLREFKREHSETLLRSRKSRGGRIAGS